MLDLAEIEAGRFELRRASEPLSHVIEETLVATLKPLAEAKRVALHVEVEVEPELVVTLDRGRVFQVLSNLVGNAIEFTPEGGAIVVSTTLEEANVLLSVADTGPGIAPADRARIFDRYWQAPTRQAGGSASASTSPRASSRLTVDAPGSSPGRGEAHVSGLRFPLPS